EGLLHQKNFLPEKIMYISLEKSHMTIAVMRDRKIEYCNTFLYHNEQDFVYFVMLTMDGLQLSPDDCKVILYGEIVEDSMIFNNIFKYVRYVALGSRPTNLKYSYRFDDVLDHRYFDLYNIYLCV
ncbi:MAG: DUF3822 family protein, partial [Verrucomicrobia bacterium]|nr:DUF3822 family protein [Cytophagales bacterium]